MTRLAFENVACIRGGRPLFSGVSIVVETGGAAIVTGPNGTGKSSLLRIAAGLLPVAEGLVRKDGAVALADENAALDRDLPLGTALDFWAGLDGRRDRVAESLAAFGIAHLAPVPVRMLSTGQRKRAVLARVLASGARIWLLDEPTNGMDADGIERLEQACAQHRTDGGIVLAATHQPFELPSAHSISLGTSGRAPAR